MCARQTFWKIFSINLRGEDLFQPRKRDCKGNEFRGLLDMPRREANRKGMVQVLHKFASEQDAMTAGVLGLVMMGQTAEIAMALGESASQSVENAEVVAEKYGRAIFSAETGAECSCGQVHDSEHGEGTEILAYISAVQVGAMTFAQTEDSDAALAAANGFIERVEFHRLALHAQ